MSDLILHTTTNHTAQPYEPNAFADTATVRKTFQISEANAAKMRAHLSPRKQTVFVNQALAQAFAQLEKTEALAVLSTKLSNIKRIQSNESIVETLRAVRAERQV